jgi:hypothetical protein
LRITYPSGFNFGSFTAAFYNDSDGTNTNPDVSKWAIDGQAINVFLDTTGSSPAANSIIEIRLANIRNDTVRGDYHIALEILAPDSTLLFGPTLSKAFRVSAGVATKTLISPRPGVVLAAGSTQVFTSTVTDQFGNRIDTASTYSLQLDTTIGTLFPTVSLTGTAFLARRVGSGLVYTRFASLVDSCAVTITPGPLAAWSVAGFPPATAAGDSLGFDSVTVTAKDAYDNRKTNYTQSVYFTATDPSVLLPATAAGPRTFVSGDNGQVKFPLSSFRFLRAGADTIVTTNGTITARSPIYISPAPAATFELTAPGTAAAGQSFLVVVSNAIDSYGNPASGVVELSLNSADSLSPDGRPPLLPAVSVTNGAGSASAQLYRAGRYPIMGRIGGTFVVTDSVTVGAADPGRFEWDISTPQISFIPFSGTATLTAYDPWGNLAVDYDPGGSPVTLSATNGDSMSNNSLFAGSFINGMSDLTIRGVTYHGRGGQVRFFAQNGSASGTSDPVNVLAVTVDTLRFDQSTVRRGVDTLTGTISVSIAGTGVFNVTSLRLVSTGTFALSNVTPALPSSFTGPGTRDFVFRWPVPASLPEGCMSFETQAQGAFGTDTAAASFSGGPCVNITSAASLRVEAVYPTQIAYGGVDYWLSLANDGPQAVTVDLGDVYAVITDSSGRSDSAASVSSGQTLLSSGASVLLQLTASHAAGFDGDSAFLSLVVSGTEIGQPFGDTIPFGVLHFMESAALSYVTGSLAPDTLVSGRADTVTLRLANMGEAAIDSLSSDSTFLRLEGIDDTATLRSLNLPSAFPPGDTTLRFFISADASRLAGSLYSPVLRISGRQNNRLFVRTLALPESITLVGPGSVRVDSAWTSSPNRPHVTTLQDFTVSAAITNTGSEPLDSILLRLSADGGALFVDTLSAASLNPGETTTAAWTVTADATPVALETFTVDVIRAVGRYTSAESTVDPALDAQASVQVQTPAALAVRVGVASPPSAADLRIAAGSEFVIAARFENSGQAQTGIGQLELLLSGGLTTSDPTIVSVGEGADASWSIQAPASEGLASAAVRFASVPVELNTGAAASVVTPRDSLLIDVVFEAPPLVIRDVQFDSGMVDDEFAPMSWRWHNEDASGSFPILVQSLEFELLSASTGTVLDAASVIQSAELQFSNDTALGSFVGGRLHFGTDSLRRIAPGDSEDVSLSVRLRTAGALQEFRFATRAALWSSVERSVGGSGLAVAVLDERGLPLDLESPLAFQPGDVPTNFPNPFRAGLESTQIQYRLNSDSPVELVLYTTAGREVWRFHAEAGAPGGRQGANTVLWDGLNANGDLVLDGVYIARLTGGGVETTIKIAVVK